MNGKVEKKILIVDGDEMTSKLMKFFFGSYTTIELACNGEEGVRKLQGEYFDLIISDIDMPSMNGIDMYLEAEKTDPHIKNRFLFITATGNYENIDFLKEQNLNYLEKPTPIGQIRAMAMRILDGSPCNYEGEL